MNLADRTGSSIINSLVGILAQAAMVVSSFVCRMVFVKCLTEAYLGINGLFSNVLSMLTLAELGIGSAIVYELYHALAIIAQNVVQCFLLIVYHNYQCESIVSFCGIEQIGKWYGQSYHNGCERFGGYWVKFKLCIDFPDANRVYE